MNKQEMKKLQKLLLKLADTTKKTASEDSTFRKYHAQSIDSLRSMIAHVKELEGGLKIASALTSSAND